MSDAAIFKLFMNRRNDGAWQIAAMKGIDLKAKELIDPDHYAIDDAAMVWQQPPMIGTVGSLIGESIVPIVANVTGENTFRCIGTGFFVSCSGLLITAAHVVTDPIESKYGGIKELDDLTIYAQDLSFGVLVANNPIFEPQGYHFYPIEWAMFLAERREAPLPIFGLDLKLNSDIAICKVTSRPNGPPHQPLTLIQSGIQGTGIGIGANVTAIGYGAMTEEIEFNQRGQIIGQSNFQLHVSRGTIIERYSDNFIKKSVPTPGPCFSFAAKIPGGMSGSPIFDREGIYVHGVISKGWKDESGVAKLGFGSMLAPSMGLPILKMNGSTLKEIQESHAEGMPILRGAGL